MPNPFDLNSSINGKEQYFQEVVLALQNMVLLTSYLGTRSVTRPLKPYPDMFSSIESAN
jgi:hypothetical protein